MTTLTKTKRANGLGTKNDVKSTASTLGRKTEKPAIEKKAVNENKEEVKATSSVETPVNGKAPIIDKQQADMAKPVELPSPPPIPVPELSLEQKIEKVENLKVLIEKREVLEESRKKLNSFVVGSPQFGENIKLTDENGNTFQTSNTEVFSKVVETIKSTLIEKIKEIETQIQF
jgi:hypothetical protein